MEEVRTQVEEDKVADEQSEVKPILHITGVTKWEEPGSDEEIEESHHLNVLKAWHDLFSLASCAQIFITLPIQRKILMEVGVNVTQEFPWKQIKYKYLRDNLFDNVDYAMAHSMAVMDKGPNDPILIGYAPLLTQNKDDVPDGDPFIYFINSADSKIALAIIENIEAYERWKMNQHLIKKPRKWLSLGSEAEVDFALEESELKPFNVEIQSVYPLKIPLEKVFTLRKTTDVRDGYVELLPPESIKFDNITRRRITLGIQSAPSTVSIEVQTDPTFPTNAWCQYLYEIDEEDDGIDPSSGEEEEKKGDKSDKSSGSSKPTPTQTPADAETPDTPNIVKPIELSYPITLLLKTLELNQIDMYRNDYPLISSRKIEHYTSPYLEETLCFANISKSVQRYVCGIDWYPNLSGLIVTSYTFNTPATISSITVREDEVQKAVLEPNPILMWSFSDNLDYKLEFESPREMNYLSFCPYNPDVLIGGAKNGQIIIWDLQERAERLDQEEVLTTAQARYRVLINDFLKWTIQIDEESIIAPAVQTALEVSQTGPITCIYWFGPTIFITGFGKLYIDTDPKASNKVYVTCSFDGTIVFWNLDGLVEKKQQGYSSKADRPAALTMSESSFKNKISKPIFTIAYNEPITGIIADTALFHFKTLETKKRRRNKFNYGIYLENSDPKEVRQSAIISTFYGRIERINWTGVYAETDAKENVQSVANFARVHDGPVVSMKKNPYYPQIFASIGRNILAVWKEDYNYSPIFWRRRICDLTAIAWSTERPSVLFVTRIDGNLEAWDILSRDDDTSINEILGGGVVTAISEYPLTEPEKVLGIGDYNSSFRMVKLPTDFYIPMENETEKLIQYVQKQELRKRSIQAWEQQYYENNRDIIEVKRQAEIEARKEMERLQKEEMLLAARRQMEEAEELKAAAEPLKNVPYPERMQRLWHELNLNRLLGILMTRKRVDAEQLERDTKLEKERLAYEQSKKDALVRTLQNVAEEVAKVRSRILPVEKVDLQRSDLIKSMVDELMSEVDEYEEFEGEANLVLDKFPPLRNIDYIEFFNRGEHRRYEMNKGLGSNTERLHWYEIIKESRTIGDYDWGYDYYLNAHYELNRLKEEEEYQPTFEFSDSFRMPADSTADEEATE